MNPDPLPAALAVAPARGPFTMNVRGFAMIVIGVVEVLLLLELFTWLMPGAPRVAVALYTVAVAVPTLFFLMRRVVQRGLRDTLIGVSNGLVALGQQDYSLRLTSTRDDEVGQLAHRFNRLSEILRRERSELYQKEMIPQVILASTTMSVVLHDDKGHIIYANPAARAFYAGGAALEGRRFDEVLGAAPTEVQAAARSSSDVLFTCLRPGEAEPETFHLSRRYFELSNASHTLVVLRPLTREIARKEVETWKKAIRVLSHELNNSLAPISSLCHSARLMLDNPAHAGRLRGALDTIDERARHLKTFLDGYASFARLPLPTKRHVPWGEVLGGVAALYSFQLEGALPERPGFVDPAQFQQVLINLLKNAVEAGSAPGAITVAFRNDTPDGVTLEISDRGRGMPAEALKDALVPFFSTKKTGTGLGLALCREIVDAHGGRLSLHPRPEGGLTVRCWLPHGPNASPT